MAKMVFHNDDGSVIETGPRGRTDSPEDVRSRGWADACRKN